VTIPISSTSSSINIPHATVPSALESTPQEPESVTQETEFVLALPQETPIAPMSPSPAFPTIHSAVNTSTAPLTHSLQSTKHPLHALSSVLLHQVLLLKLSLALPGLLL
jgi:hypothetical protein